ncbi:MULTISPECIES: hypothetical protein [unclassified Glutamicibacter]|uniref:hypothetical protein n=1 Tax=unclassified Glutamicibacter TaxID=2627139 RepID=UPI0037FB9156
MNVIGSIPVGPTKKKTASITLERVIEAVFFVFPAGASQSPNASESAKLDA